MRRAPIWTLSTLLLVAAAALAAEAAKHPDLSGVWQLDPDRSDRPGGRGGLGGPGGGGPGGERPGGGPRAEGGRGGFGGDREAMRARREQRQLAVARLEIAATGEGGWSLKDGVGVTWSIEPDGAERKVEGPEGGEIYLRAEWTDASHLRVRRVQAGRPAIEESYELAADGQSLTVTVRMVGGEFGDRETRRVYGRTAAAAPGE